MHSARRKKSAMAKWAGIRVAGVGRSFFFHVKEDNRRSWLLANGCWFRTHIYFIGGMKRGCKPASSEGGGFVPPDYPAQILFRAVALQRLLAELAGVLTSFTALKGLIPEN